MKATHRFLGTGTLLLGLCGLAMTCSYGASTDFQTLGWGTNHNGRSSSHKRRPPTTQTNDPPSLVIDHSAVNLFSQIPSNYLAAAKAIPFYLRHASVGANISEGLDLLATNATYNRSSFHFIYEGNPGWKVKVDDFNSYVRASHTNSALEALQMKFCFIDTDVQWSYYRDVMAALVRDFPQKRMIWWTTPITTNGDSALNAFNNLLRAYAQTNAGTIVLDLADIESHDTNGAPYTYGGIEAMVQSYSTDGGHLTTLGEVRVAQSLWVLTARLAGWTNGTTPGTLAFRTSAYAVGEAAGSVRLYVSRSGGSSSAASVSYATANATATAGADYTAVSGTLSWADGDTADKYFDVPILNDLLAEGNETFTASLSAAQGAALGAPSLTTVTIADDEPPPGLVAYWPLDGTAADTSSGGRAGALTGGTSWTTGRVGSGALLFDGVSGRMTIPALSLTTTYTVALWLYPVPSSDAYGTLLDQNGSHGFWYLGTSRKVFLSPGPSSRTAMVENQWHHVAVVCNAGAVTYYLDGVADGTATGGAGFSARYLGDDPSSSSFRGRMDDVRVYNRALSAAEVAVLAQIPASPSLSIARGTPGSVVLVLQSGNNQSYLLQASGDLARWVQLTNITWTGTLLLPEPCSSTRQFYRLVPSSQ